MSRWDFETLRRFEGRTVRLKSTESEIIVAKVVSVSEDQRDVVIDVLSTNQPERYVRMRKRYDECAWAIPFEFIESIEVAGSADIVL